MDAKTLADAMGNRPGVDYARWVDGINRAMILGGITNANRAAMFCAQVGAESGGLQWMEELADGSEYNGRADLGNTQPGDGPRYKGRGPIQITGRHNYGALSQWAHQHAVVPSATYFLDRPGDLMLPQYVWLGPIWYWTVARPNLNALADARDIMGCTRAINGGYNGLDGRTARWRHCLALGAAILPTRPPAPHPTPHPTPAPAPAPHPVPAPHPAPAPTPPHDWFDMATALDLQAEIQRGLVAMLTGKPNAHVGAAQATNLHAEFVAAVRQGANFGLYVRFINAGPKNNQAAVYAVIGNHLLYINAPTYGWLGTPPVRVMDMRSPYWHLPIEPGTPDYRGKA